MYVCFYDNLTVSQFILSKLNGFIFSVDLIWYTRLLLWRYATKCAHGQITRTCKVKRVKPFLYTYISVEIEA